MSEDGERKAEAPCTYRQMNIMPQFQDTQRLKTMTMGSVKRKP